MARSEAAAKKLAEMRAYVDGVAKKLADDVYGPQGLPWGTRLSELEDMVVTFREAISAKMMDIILAGGLIAKRVVHPEGNLVTVHHSLAPLGRGPK